MLNKSDIDVSENDTIAPHHFNKYKICKDFLYIPSLGINIDTSVKAAFMTDKLKAAKSYFDIADC